MTVIRMSVTIPEWMYKELALGRNNNKSERVQELLMKGFMFEKGISFEKKKELNVVMAIASPERVLAST